jgi:hypothetical protein
MFTDQDLSQIQARGMQVAEVNAQIENFKQGFPYLHITKAATIGDGIIQLEAAQIERYQTAYNTALPNLKVVKFVPASGAASRMFKSLFSFMSSYEGTPEQAAAFQADQGPHSLYTFFDRLSDFAFYQDLKATFTDEPLQEVLARKDYVKILRHLLTEEGLGYGELPKGLLKFHRYPDGSRTPTEEHLVEGIHYCTDKGTVYLHLTVSPEHRERFEAHVTSVQAHYESQYGVKLEVSFSEQKPATDTIAVDMNNEPFREEDDSLLFRPGGHGALIENLNELDADLVFIKNIDNVVPDRIKEETYRFKKALAGLLLSVQEKVFGYLRMLQTPSPHVIEEVSVYLQQELCVLPPPAFTTYSETEKVTYLKGKLHRPIRVCGMVKNAGEPGGGPFWARNPDETISLQIAETAQIDQESSEQMDIMQHATHFNPVDLMVTVKDHQGQRFDLPKHRDPKTGFISQKSKDGRDLKAQELPGLWNGAMSDWNTLFVEVPVITFNPVKVVNDLLREQHQ